MNSDNIIIVGSSDVVLENRLGNKIDQYNTIVRFNRAPTKGFEEYVGSKTTMRFINTHAVKNLPKQNEDLTFLPKLKNQVISSDYGLSDDEFYSVFDKTCTFKVINRFKNFDKFKSNHLNNLNLDIGIPGSEPSVGLNAICHFINNGKKPTIYGFHLHDDNGRVSPHYWKQKLKVGTCHNFSYERKLIRKLIEHNYIELLT